MLLIFNLLIISEKHVCSAALGRVCIKLVVIMGVTWIADVLSWAHNVAMKDSSIHIIKHDVRYYFWYIMDAINALQGVLIFLVVASQPQVSHFLKYMCNQTFIDYGIYFVVWRFCQRLENSSHQKIAVQHQKMVSIIQVHQMV